MTNTLSHRRIEKFESYIGTVVKRIPSGCIINLDIENGDVIQAFNYGTYTPGDRVLVSITKMFEDDRLPRVLVDSVLQYAFDNLDILSMANNDHSQTAA